MCETYLEWFNEHTPGAWWHDSAIPREIDAAIGLGALGVTTNPVLTYKALSEQPEYWQGEVSALPADMPPCERAEALLEIVATHAASKVYGIYIQTSGQHGYAFGQLNPDLAGDREGMLAQGLRVASWAENMAVKIPTSKAALYVIEELSARGIAVCASLNFSVSQAVAVAEAYKRGLARAQAGGKPAKPCYVVQQGGRLEDYLKLISSDLELRIADETIEKAGNFLTKRSCRVFDECDYKAVIMPAGLRGLRHITELAGARIVTTLQTRIQKMILDADPAKVARYADEDDAGALESLMRIKEFRRAYDIDGLQADEFASFGVFQKTLSQFMETGWAMLERYGGKSSERWT